MAINEIESGSPVGEVVTITDTRKWISAKEFRERYMKRWNLAKLSITSVYYWMDCGVIESEYERGRGYVINPKSLRVPLPKRGRPNKKKE